MVWLGHNEFICNIEPEPLSWYKTSVSGNFRLWNIHFSFNMPFITLYLSFVTRRIETSSVFISFYQYIPTVKRSKYGLCNLQVIMGLQQEKLQRMIFKNFFYCFIFWLIIMFFWNHFTLPVCQTIVKRLRNVLNSLNVLSDEIEFIARGHVNFLPGGIRLLDVNP